MTQKISPEVFVSAARIASEMRSRSTCEIIAAPHQLPDAPPPPNEPPPPEKPPPPENPPPPETPPPPEKPPEDPVHQDDPDDPDDQGLADLRRRRLFAALGIAPTIIKKTSPNTTSAKIRVIIVPQGGVGSGRRAAR